MLDVYNGGTMEYIGLAFLLLIVSSFLTTAISVINTYNDPREPLLQHRRPLIGGIKITSRLDDETISIGTIGYSAYYNGIRGIVTAGHFYYINDYLGQDLRTYQPVISDQYYLNKPLLINFNNDDRSQLDVAFVPYGYTSNYVAYIEKDGDTYNLNKIYIGAYANYNWIEDFINGFYTVYKTGENSSTTKVYLNNQIYCTCINNVIICNKTIAITYDGEQYEGIPAPIGAGDSGGPVFHCFYNLCDDNADGILIGIVVSGARFSQIRNDWILAIVNAYAVDHYYDIKLWG